MIPSYPLTWPAGWKRTPGHQRGYGRFSKQQGSNSYRRDLTIYDACSRLIDELQKMGVSRDDLVISSNLKTRLDGLPRSDAGNPGDPGVAVYWTDRGETRCMAIDQYTHVAQNIAALAATLSAMRAIERHGGAAILDRAFTGFAALPYLPERGWREVLEVGQDAGLDEVRQAHRRLASMYHPDKPGGSHDAMAEVNQAMEQAEKELA